MNTYIIVFKYLILRQFHNLLFFLPHKNKFVEKQNLFYLKKKKAR